MTNRSWGTRVLVSVAFLAILAACGGGGGDGTPPATDDGGGGGGGSGGGGGTATPITFSGGSIDDLRALSPTLTFNDLVISGKLRLSYGSNHTLTVRNLTITPTGSVGHTYTACEYRDSPNIAINASGNVEISGGIELSGRAGTSVTSGATCNSCYGRKGGSVAITAATLRVAAIIDSDGGSSGTVRDSGLPSYGCPGGASGTISLTASNIELTSANLQASGGRGGAEGFGYGPSGAKGEISLAATGLLKLETGDVSTDGLMKLVAGETKIFGPITYGTINATIGGGSDSAAPLITVLTPVSTQAIRLDQPLEVKIQASDAGVGVREVVLTGLGNTRTISAKGMKDGILTTQITAPQPGSVLDIVVRDNLLKEAKVTVAGLSNIYGSEADANDSPAAAMPLAFPVALQGNVSPSDTGTCDQSIASTYPDKSCAFHTAADYFQFAAPESGDYVIELEFNGNTATTDLDLYLKQAGGTSWLKTAVGDNAATKIYSETIKHSLTKGQNYTLAIQAWPSWTGRATYRLIVRPATP